MQYLQGFLKEPGISNPYVVHYVEPLIVTLSLIVTDPGGFNL
jgi:hypothetical protein